VVSDRTEAGGQVAPFAIQDQRRGASWRVMQVFRPNSFFGKAR
jgi:hypothetical protein